MQLSTGGCVIPLISKPQKYQQCPCFSASCRRSTPSMTCTAVRRRGWRTRRSSQWTTRMRIFQIQVCPSGLLSKFFAHHYKILSDIYTEHIGHYVKHIFRAFHCVPVPNSVSTLNNTENAYFLGRAAPPPSRNPSPTPRNN